LRIATGDGEGGVGERRGVRRPSRQLVQEGEQVVGITAGQVEADMEMDRAAELVGDGLEPFAKLLIAGGRLDELEVGRRGLQIGTEERGVMAVA